MSLGVVPVDVLTVNPWAQELVPIGKAMGCRSRSEVAATIRLRRLP